MSLSENPLQPRRTARWFLRTAVICGITAALIFLPFQIIDGGWFHYAGDFNSQQITFYRAMNLFLKQGGTYVWTADLGSGAVNAYSFYLLGSPFFWLSMLLPAEWVPYAMVPLLVLKFALAGGGAFLYLKRYTRKMQTAMLGGCMYAFCGFALYSVFFNHFVDVVTLFPYLLWSLDEAVYKDRKGLFAFFAALNLINNYFFFFGQIVFLVIYVVCRLAAREMRLTPRLFFRLAFESLLAAAMGFLLALPAVFSLMQNPRTIDMFSGWSFLTYAKPQQYLAILTSWLLPPDSPYLTSIWSEGIIKWTNMTAYIPMFSLAGVIAYCRSRRGTAAKHILLFCAVCALVPALNSAFYMMNSSYYARWYYMPVLIMVQVTLNALEDETVDLSLGFRPTLIAMLATLVYAVVPVYDSETESWSFGVLHLPAQYAAVVGFGIAGLLLAALFVSKWRRCPDFGARMTAAVLVFSFLFGMVHIGTGKFGQWETDSDLHTQYYDALTLKEQLPEGSYRIDTYGVHDNLGVWMGKSSLLHFCSTVTPSILSFYPSVGVKRDVRSEPDVTRYGLRGLLSVQYFIVDTDETAEFEEKADDGWTLTEYGTDELKVYENENYIPMGFTYDYYINETQFENTATNSRDVLLTHAILLTDEQIEKYGSLLKAASNSDISNLGYVSYQKYVKERRASACSSFEMNNTGFTAEITLDKENLVFFSVPWDEGFTAYVNGVETDIEEVDNGLMAVCCPAGENHIEFVFRTKGFSLSSKVTLAGWSVWLLYVVLVTAANRRKKRAQQAPVDFNV